MTIHLERETCAATIRRAHDKKLLGYQIGATVCYFDYSETKDGAGCAIGVCLPSESRRVFDVIGVAVGELIAESHLSTDDDEWFARVQIAHDDLVTDKDPLPGDWDDGLTRFLLMVDHPGVRA